MDLKDFFSKEKIDKNFFWALVIEPGLVQAAVWTIEENKAKVLSTSNPVSWMEDEEMINACDASLSSAIQNFPEDIREPSKTVFGVSSKWVENGEIKEEYIGKIKKVCSELSLEPAGFVVLSEAIAFLIKSEEGAPLSAIIIAARQDNIELSLFRLGNLVGTTTVARSVSVADDVIEGLTRFGLNESYPSRFLIYDGKEGELEDIKQNLLSFDWEAGEKIKFLHTPKIEIINPERKITATALAGASEISDVNIIESFDKENEEIPEDIENVSIPDKNIKPEDLGFMVGEDVGKGKEEINKESINRVSTYQIKQEIPKEIQKKVNIFNALLARAKSIFKKAPEKSLSDGGNKKKLIYTGISLVVILIIGFIFWWFLPKAVVTVYVSPKKLEERIEIVVDSSVGSNNFSEGIIKGEKVESIKEGEKTKSTSGTKTVGEKAKGTVKIQNGTANSIKLNAGTILLSNNNLEFTLDNSASISAAISPSSPGEANVDVTASNIGADSNIAKDETLKVSNYPKSDVDAIVLSNFSGGSSRDISVVSQNDQNDLLEELREELLNEAINDIKSNLDDNLFLIEDSFVATDSSKVFSNKVGDEALNLKLNLSIESTAVSVNEGDFFDYINNTLSDQIPAGYVLRNDQVNVRFDLKDIEKEKYIFDVTIEINLLPQIDTDDIKGKIKGRGQNVVEKYLETVPGYSRAEIKFDPILPGRLNTLPHVIQNINIDLATER